jgi:hypothetical protein
MQLIHLNRIMRQAVRLIRGVELDMEQQHFRFSVFSAIPWFKVRARQEWAPAGRVQCQSWGLPQVEARTLTPPFNASSCFAEQYRACKHVPITRHRPGTILVSKLSTSHGGLRLQEELCRLLLSAHCWIAVQTPAVGSLLLCCSDI